MADGSANTTHATYFQETGTNSWSDPATGTTQTSEYTYYYGVDSNNPNEPDWGQMLGGSEIYDGVERLYGADWASLGQKSSVDLAAAVNDTDSGFAVLTTAEKDSLPSALVAPQGETYAQVEDMPGGNGDTETTYYDSNGTVLGYAMETSWSYDDPSGTTQTGSNTSYNDANWNWLGGSWSDDYGSGFNTNETVSNSDGSRDVDLDGDGSADITAASYRVETGGFTPSGATEPENTYEFYYDDSYNMLGGKESFGAETIIYGADWTVASQSTDTSKLTLQASDLSTVPSDFIDSVLADAGVSNTETTITVTHDGSDFAFANANGDAVTSFAVSEGDTIIFDTSDSSMDGKGFSFGTANDGSASLTTGVTDAGTAGATGASTTLVVSTGTAADGSTTELYIFAADNAGTPVISIDVNDNKTIYESTENFAWGGGSETTFFVNGDVIGYAESYSDAGMPGGGASSYESFTFYDSDHNRVGDRWSDDYGSGSNFRLKLTEAVDIDGDGTNDFGTFDLADGSANTTHATYFQETGTNSWSDPATGTTQTSEYTYYYGVDSNNPNEPDWGQMLGGSEIYDGVERLYGADWASLGQKSSVDLAAAVNDTDSGFAVLTTAEKDSLPSALVAPQGETYAQVEDMPGGNGDTETTYYDSNGTVLGYAMETSWSYDDPSGTTQTGSNTSYNDANREFIGSSFTDSYGTGFNTNETVSISAPVDIDLDGDGTAEFTISDASYPSSYRVETGGFTPTDTNESGSTNTHYFSSTGEHLGGMDVYGAQTTIYGANWNVTSTSTDTSQLTLTAVDTNAVPSEFLDAAAPNVGAATVTIAVTVDTPVGGTPTFLFDGSAIPADFSINEGDVYVFDTSDSSMDGFEIGFSTVANSAADALTTGVTVNGIPGTTGANTTLILPVEYGGVDGTGGQELHIIGKQAVMEVVDGPQAPAPSVTLVAGDIDLYVQADTNGDALGGVLTNPNPGGVKLARRRRFLMLWPVR